MYIKRNYIHHRVCLVVLVGKMMEDEVACDARVLTGRHSDTFISNKMNTCDCIHISKETFEKIKKKKEQTCRLRLEARVKLDATATKKHINNQNHVIYYKVILMNYHAS